MPLARPRALVLTLLLPALVGYASAADGSFEAARTALHSAEDHIWSARDALVDARSGLIEIPHHQSRARQAAVEAAAALSRAEEILGRGVASGEIGEETAAVFRRLIQRAQDDLAAVHGEIPSRILGGEATATPARPGNEPASPNTEVEGAVQGAAPRVIPGRVAAALMGELHQKAKAAYNEYWALVFSHLDAVIEETEFLSSPSGPRGNNSFYLRHRWALQATATAWRSAEDVSYEELDHYSQAVQVFLRVHERLCGLLQEKIELHAAGGSAEQMAQLRTAIEELGAMEIFNANRGEQRSRPSEAVVVPAESPFSVPSLREQLNGQGPPLDLGWWDDHPAAEELLGDLHEHDVARPLIQDFMRRGGELGLATRPEASVAGGVAYDPKKRVLIVPSRMLNAGAEWQPERSILAGVARELWGAHRDQVVGPEGESGSAAVHQALRAWLGELQVVPVSDLRKRVAAGDVFSDLDALADHILGQLVRDISSFAYSMNERAQSTAAATALSRGEVKSRWGEFMASTAKKRLLVRGDGGRFWIRDSVPAPILDMLATLMRSPRNAD